MQNVLSRTEASGSGAVIPLPQQATDDLLDTVKAAEVLDLKPATLEVWRCQKKHTSLRYLKIGGKVRYRRSDLLAWLEERTIGMAA